MFKTPKSPGSFAGPPPREAHKTPGPMTLTPPGSHKSPGKAEASSSRLCKKPGGPSRAPRPIIRLLGRFRSLARAFGGFSASSFAAFVSFSFDPSASYPALPLSGLIPLGLIPSLPGLYPILSSLFPEPEPDPSLSIPLPTLRLAASPREGASLRARTL
jgi:hypothetical protein